MLVSEIGTSHGLLFNHICLVVLIVVPEGLLELLRDVLHDILLGLRLRRHNHGGHLVQDLIFINYFTSRLLFFDEFALGLG